MHNFNYVKIYVYNIISLDRHTWWSRDFFYISEVMFCMANVLTICRLTYILAFSHHTGPLIVTLGKMMVVRIRIYLVQVVNYHLVTELLL